MSFSNYLTPEELRALLLEEAADPSGHAASPISEGRDAWSALAHRVDKLEGEVARLKEILKTIQQTAAADGHPPTAEHEEGQPEITADRDGQAPPEPLMHDDAAPGFATEPEDSAASGPQQTEDPVAELPMQTVDDPESSPMSQQAPVQETPDTPCQASDPKPLPDSQSSVQPEPDVSLLAVHADESEHAEETGQADLTDAVPPTEPEDSPSTTPVGVTAAPAEPIYIPPHFRHDGDLAPRSQRHPRPQSWLARLRARWNHS
ncbi:hypothetical protein [Paenibacillus methanolicus]|uniref:Uncharacterized protein n=1 Tax=Paenibacillus methanolicus TaxID=582686 RepID=A0A5S5C162_9BACL|nr:hypothetical protein [Paenibacillus methanolicus]TYP72358.1 hypothetical protein BCM02_10812 [Paenibacillus methanolicus]